jgi:hypothetical protein
MRLTDCLWQQRLVRLLVLRLLVLRLLVLVVLDRPL